MTEEVKPPKKVAKTQSENYKRWYEANKEKFSELRKKRYREDPEYRKAQEASRAKAKARKQPVDPLPAAYTHTITQAAEAVGVSVSVIRKWMNYDYFPHPYTHKGCLYFTDAQVGMLCKLEADLPKTRLTTSDKTMAALEIAQNITNNWS